MLKLRYTRSILFGLTMLLLTATLNAQTDVRYWVYFQDKGPVAEEGKAFVELSERALERRHKQGIAIDWYDIPVYQPYIDSLINLGFTIHVSSRWINAVSVSVAEENALGSLGLQSMVRKVERVKSYRMPEESIAFQPATFRQAENTEPEYGNAANQVEMIQLDKLHGLGYTGEGIQIAVLDGGFTAVDTGVGYQSFWDKEQILGTFNFADNNENVFFSALHGSYVLSIMGSDIPGSYVGAAPDAGYFLFRTEVVDSERVAEEDFWLAAAEYSDFIGVDIINSSLGYTTFDIASEDHSYNDMDGNTTVVTRAADIAASKGILVCNSAGNSGNSDWQYIGAPADGDSVFSIGAVDPDGIYASFSSRGPTADGRIKPNIAVQGAFSAVVHPNGAIYIGSGTSFSSPLAAGAAACLWQAFPEKTNMEIMQAMQKSASQAAAPDNFLGYGIPNMFVAYYMLSGASFDNLQGETLGLFPNPADNSAILVIENGIGSSSFYTITDMQGRIVSRTTLPTDKSAVAIVPVDFSGLSKGTYLLSLVQLDIEKEVIVETISFTRL